MYVCVYVFVCVCVCVYVCVCMCVYVCSVVYYHVIIMYVRNKTNTRTDIRLTGADGGTKGDSLLSDNVTLVILQ